MRALLLVSLFMLPLAAGAQFSPFYVTTLNALAALDADRLKRFYLVPDENLNTGGLEHQQIARQIVVAMEMGGFTQVTEPMEAEIALYVNYGITGPRMTYQQLQSGLGSTDTEYDRELVLIAADAQKFLASGEAVEVWRASMVSTGSSRTLSDVIPAMLAKSYEYFGTDLRRPKTLRVTGANDIVAKLRDL